MGSYYKNEISIEPKFRKCVTGYGFLSFPKKFGNKYGKKLMNTATKTGIDAAKTTSKRIVQATAEATGDSIGNKTADKITSIDKPREKKRKEIEEIYIPPEIRIKTSMLRSDLCYFSDAYIVVKGIITVTEPDDAKK